MPFPTSLLLQASAVLVLLLAVLSTAADAVGPSRKLAQNNVVYYDKSKCIKGAATFDFEDDHWVCNKGIVACCCPSSDKCYAGTKKFRCKTGDDINNCCTA